MKRILMAAAAMMWAVSGAQGQQLPAQLSCGFEQIYACDAKGCSNNEGAIGAIDFDFVKKTAEFCRGGGCTQNGRLTFHDGQDMGTLARTFVITASGMTSPPLDKYPLKMSGAIDRKTKQFSMSLQIQPRQVTVYFGKCQ